MKARRFVSAALVLALAPLGLVGCAQPAASSSTASNAAGSSTASSSTASNGSAGNGSAANSAGSTTSEAPKSGASDNSVAPGETAGASEISADRAKEVALEHANLTEADIFDLKVELDRDDVTPHYEVEFKRSNVEYDYKISLDGTILAANSEIDNDVAD